MQHANTYEVAASRLFELWPPGWPLPVTATASALRWGDLVELYLAYCESTWGPAAGPATIATEIPPAQRQAA
jgi:hypothetical protein